MTVPPSDQSTVEWRVLWCNGATTVGLHDREEAEALLEHASKGVADFGLVQSRRVTPWTPLASDEEQQR